ncbi:DMT family transporter [Salinisphaera japonica]|uniref:Guanidinium exporter n=1 Tax=Salinisphaera japonica YTM-1 TaxID=1209778 RepID=A0A423PH90_9GAMM|nr:SMR family transporter [Salinisphaera japonica]ROO24846.1 multidrug resistance protein SMR [Salinisphaera japonica YTM-1]
MAWLWLAVAGICEIIGVVGFARTSHGQRASGLVLAVGGFTAGLTCLHAAMATIPMAVAYSVFTAFGTLGSTAIGILFWGDSARPARLAWIAGLIVAVIGLKITI